MTLDEVLKKHGLDPAKVPCGASCGPGWVGLIDRLIEKLIGLGWDRDLQQIKEKFGGLRFYIGVGSAEVWDAIEKAEEEASKTCEECGKPGRPRGGGWISTLCDGCVKR